MFHGTTAHPSISFPATYPVHPCRQPVSSSCATAALSSTSPGCRVADAPLDCLETGQRSLVGEVRALRLGVARSRPPSPVTSHRGPTPPPASTRICPPPPADSRPPACGRLPPVPCRRAGCENSSHLDCPVVFCDAHCANARCRFACLPNVAAVGVPANPVSLFCGARTPLCVVTSHRPPTRSLPRLFQTRAVPAALNQLILSVPRDSAIVTAADARTTSSNSNFRFSCQLYADDLVILAEFEGELQLALDAVSWGSGGFSGIGPEKSAAVVFGPNRQRPACSVTLSGSVLLVVQSYRYLGVFLTRCLRRDAHAEHLVSHGHRLFAHCASWARADGLPVSLSHSLLATYVLPSATLWHGVLGHL